MKAPARTHTHQFALQAAAAFGVLSFAAPYFALLGKPLPWREISIAIGATALLFSMVARQPWWWRIIHTIFAPMTWAVSSLAIAPGWFLLAFLLTLLVYRGALEGRVPLYLSNGETARTVAQILGDAPGIRFVDLGAGVASIITRLAAIHPASQFTGIENAPLPWLFGRLRTVRQTNCKWLLGDLWRTDLSHFDIAYAFLSPEPMAELWKKATHEMRPGSLLVSNTFAIPDVVAEQEIEVDDARRTRLYCYRIPSIKDEYRCALQPPSPESGSLRQAP